MTDKTNGDPPADAPEPTGLTADVFDLAALVNTVKETFHMKEETALKTVDLALTYRLTRHQMELASKPFGDPVFAPPAPPAPEPE